MLYCGKDMGLEEYFLTRMEKDGFYKNGIDLGLEKVGGYYRSEAEFNIIAEYEASCSLDREEDKRFVENMGYCVDDFICHSDELDGITEERD